MSENKEDKSNENVGTEYNKETDNIPVSDPQVEAKTENSDQMPPVEETTAQDNANNPPKEPETKAAANVEEKAMEKAEETTTETTDLQGGEEDGAIAIKTSGSDDADKDVLEEIDNSNAEDAEDKDNQQRHQIPVLDYHSLSMENLVGEFQKLVRNEKVQAIKKHVDDIKYEFDLKFQEFIDEKKEEFVSNGGNEIDFHYNSVTKRQFNEVYTDYREKRNAYYKSLEQNLKSNLTTRLALIEELKGLVSMEEDMNTTYKHFKDVQGRWQTAGPIPRNDYNNVWRTYHHHVEIFYDFLHLNRELRDLDFKHNLEEKLKIVQRTEFLATEPDLNRAFQELQTLHKIWKEDIGPVGKEHREKIWERFSNATKVLHQRRQDYYKEQDKVYLQNLETKNGIITSINAIAAEVSNDHKGIQSQIKEIELLRDSFYKAGKVPQKVNERTWAAFKDAVRSFNRNKNNFYKNQKKDQNDNLDKKRILLDKAIALKESDDWNVATAEMKRLQNDWKKIGHVPRKYSDKIWKQFRGACNHYFDRLHSLKNEAHKEETENYEKKNACLEKLRGFQLSGKRKDDIKQIKSFIEEWKGYGRVPFNKKNINLKFNKILDALFKKMDIDRQESELLMYGNKIQQLSKGDDEQAIARERTFIRRKIDESKNEIIQLENNLQFFSNASEDNPLVQDVIKRVNKHKESLVTWEEKLKKLNIMRNSLNKETEENKNEPQDPSEKE